MANSITSFNVFVPLTKIESAKVNANFASLIAKSPLWQKVTIPYTTFTAFGAVASGTTTAFALDSNEVVHGVIVKHSTLFSGAAISAAKLKIGISGTTDKYMDEFDVNQAVSVSAKSVNQVLEFEAASTNILVTVSLTGGNLNALTQGSVDIYFNKCALP